MKVLILLIFLFVLTTCKEDTASFRNLSTAECALSYDTNEALFSDEDTLVFGVNLVYFMNGDTVEYTREDLDNKLQEVSNFFDSARIKFKLINYHNIAGVPADHLLTNKAIKERLARFDIQNYQFFAMMLNEPHVVNIYVYNELKNTQFAGVAGGIGSDYLAIRKDYFDPPVRTLAHELGHCLSLYHTHQYDDTDGYNIFHGDKVCDTPSGRSLSGRVNKECELNTKVESISDSIQRINLMSYSYPFCRKEFTPGQIKKMRWYVEQSPQAQSMLLNRHELKNKILEETWINLN